MEESNQVILEQCLREGFIDYTVQADQRYVPKILTNNRQKQRKVLDTILHQLYRCDEFLFSVAFLTKSGIACLKDAFIQNHTSRGKILASQYLNFTEPEALRELLKFPNIELRIIEESRGFHAKGYLFHHRRDGSHNYTMVIGSSNLTANALTTNEEWNVYFTSAQDGAIIRQAKEEFDGLWNSADVVDDQWIDSYSRFYQDLRKNHADVMIPFHKISPNKMQQQALKGIQAIRDKGEDRALLISATGTGKTYLSAFDVMKVHPKRFLFIVHRELIVKNAQESFIRLGIPSDKTGRLTGHDKDVDKDYLFATIQTLGQDDVLHSFAPDTFSYIVVDEVHHSGAATYQKVMQYFKPKFLLGMTATPERADGFNIFEVFHHNIAYEIRLHHALEENMLVPFHYHGISEIIVNGESISDVSSFSYLTCDERVRHIIHYADLYGSDDERVKGVVFCRNVEEAKALAKAFVEHGKRAVALCGEDSESVRMDAVHRLEAPLQDPHRLEYIFTCDIFNEGIDIPQINQIIMLRPTQSAILFVQQLGRGLRKYRHKRYLEVLDFIGNYQNNFLLPIALYGDRTYSKEFVRHLMHTNYLPGATSVHFDDISRNRIFEAINEKSALADKRKLKETYFLMKERLGRRPMMMDFVRFGDKDPALFVQKMGSLFEFAMDVDVFETTLSQAHRSVLKFLSIELANGKRIEEILVLRQLLHHPSWTTAALSNTVRKTYGFITETATMDGVADVLSLAFFTESGRKKYGHEPLVTYENHMYTRTDYYTQLLQNEEFATVVEDILAYGSYRFEQMYVHRTEDIVGGFLRYGTYSRKDVSRLLNYRKNAEGTLNGYAVKGTTCPIFVTYHKREDISANTKYDDIFESPQSFRWMTRSRRTLASNEVQTITKKETRKLLFVKKSDSEGADFYYIGDVDVYGNPTETTICNDNGDELPIVRFRFLLDKPVTDELYTYFQDE